MVGGIPACDSLVIYGQKHVQRASMEKISMIAIVGDSDTWDDCMSSLSISLGTEVNDVSR